jgi:hypothetical protein
MIDLKSRIPTLYHINSKSHGTFVGLIKKHVMPGVILYSDSHASYVNLKSSKSKLTAYGIYHFWICHMIRYVHEKFGFVHTMAIETEWAKLKRCVVGIRQSSTPKKIQSYLDSYSFRTVFRKECTH